MNVDEVDTVDYHAGGEPFRIVVAGLPEIPGDTLLARRDAAAADERVDAVRRLLCHEPRGHADMYGCFLVPPDDPDAETGVLFWHGDGYSTACGHGTIALATWAVESGRVVVAHGGETPVVLDVPSGRVVARVRCAGGAVTGVAFRNVPSYAVARHVPVATSYGEVTVDLAYGGALYASAPASAVGLAVTRELLPQLVRTGREIKHALDGADVTRHPTDSRLSGLYGTILYDELADVDGAPHQRNVTVFGDGQVDRSPCGSGTSARLALLAADGLIDGTGPLLHESVVGTRFLGRVVAETQVAGWPAVVTEVEGTSFRTGEHHFVLDPRDPVGTGFRLR